MISFNTLIHILFSQCVPQVWEPITIYLGSSLTVFPSLQLSSLAACFSVLPSLEVKG